MAEVICSLDRDGLYPYATPMAQLSPRQQRQVYEAAGIELDLGMSALGEAFDDSPGSFLIEVGFRRRLVYFPYMVGLLVEIDQ